jgi:hypothetical protein
MVHDVEIGNTLLVLAQDDQVRVHQLIPLQKDAENGKKRVFILISSFI